MRHILKTIFLTSTLLLATKSFAFECPGAPQVVKGKFTHAYLMGDNQYQVGGYFDNNGDIYQRWGMAVFVKADSPEQAKQDVNDALQPGNVNRLSTKATCSGGDEGGVCTCSYEIRIKNEIYPLGADILN